MRALAEVLAGHGRRQKEEKLTYQWADLPPWVFVTKAGTPLDACNVCRAMTSILKHAGLPRHLRE